MMNRSETQHGHMVDSPRHTILLVDDEPANLAALTNYLADCGFQILVAQTGEAGVEIARNVSPNLILLDVMLPGMDGFEVCRHLKADTRTREIPVIFMTIMTKTEDKIKGFQAGGVDYITKPFQREEVLSRVTTHLTLSRLQQELQAANVGLEQQVAARTAELQHVNQQLQSELAERKQAEEALKASEAKYMNLYENAPDMYVSVNAKTALIEKCNHTLANTLGYSKEEIIGRPVLEIYHPDCLEEVKKIFKLFVETGEIHDKELQLRRKDSSKLDVSLNISFVRDEDGHVFYSQSTLRDITERKRHDAINASRLHLIQFAITHSLDELLEETLNEAEKLTNSLIGFYHFVEDDQQTLTLQNWSTRTKAEFCKAEGKGLHYAITEAGVWVDCVYQRKPVIHNAYASLPHRKGMPEGHAEVIRELVVPVLRGEKIKAILGVGNKPSDYTEQDVEVISLLADLAWEIAERKQAEEAIHRLNRELRALSSCNQVLLRVDDEQTLLNEICRIICDEAGYRLAWIGYAEHDEAKTVRPVAWAGFDNGYIANARLSWADDTERGQGPAGKVIRSGEIIYVQDFTTDPHMAPWRESALQHGYRSGIALPLKDENAQVFGALLIYSAEVNAITPDEIRLMGELVNDLAFGITVLHTRAERKRAEEALKNQYSTLRSIIDSTNALIFSVDRQYRYTSFNTGHAAVMHALYDAEIETGQSLLEYMTVREDRETAQHNLDRALAGEQLVEEAYSGEELRSRQYFQVSHSPIKTETGEIIGVAVLAQDMTERKRMEEILRQSEHRKTVLNQIANIFLTVSDEEMYAEVLSIILQVLPSPFGIFGYIGETGDLIIPSLTGAIWKACQVPDKSLVFPSDTWGESLWGKAIRERKAFFSDGPFHTPEGHVPIDHFLTVPIVFGQETIGLISVANKAGGYTEADKELLEYITAYVAPILHARLQRDIQERERKRAEEELTKHREHLEELVAERTAALEQEILERKHIEHALHEAKDAAEAANRAKSVFLANMSHDLRTPLNAILGYAQLLKREKNLTAKQQEQLMTIHSNGEYLLTLISDLLDLGRIEAQRMGVDVTTFNLSALLHSLLDASRLKAEEKSLFVRYEALSPIPVMVKGDERKLRQVLLNLLDNAVKYTEHGGVTLRVRLLDGEMGRWGAREMGSEGDGERGRLGVFRPITPSPYLPISPSPHLLFEVEDTGIGIPDEQMQAIFEPFTRGDSRPTEGTGLGLAICHRLIELMGGRLSVISEVDKGSTFTVELDLEVVEAVATAEKAPEKTIIGYQGERKRLLIVDDNITNLAMLVATLEPLGFAIETADSGEEALHKAGATRPDLILLDLLMSGMDGHETLRRLRRTKDLGQIKVIGVSAAVADKGRVEAFAAACDAFIVKPIDIGELLETLKAQLQLDWIEEGAEAIETLPAAEVSSVDTDKSEKWPPQTVVDELLDKVEWGDFTRLEKILDRLEGEDKAYRVFCDRIRAYARRFDDDSIINYLS